MKTKSPVDEHLTEQQINELLHANADSDSIQLLEDSMAQHLEVCSDCQARLEKSAAEPWLWDSASEILHPLSAKSSASIRSIETTTFEPTSSKEAVAIHSADPIEDEIEIANEAIHSLLEAPSHPEMLGRIQGYEIECVIGTGGSGVVFKAFDRELNRPVAIKILAPRYSSIGAARKRFSREARAAAAICHENVVSIHRIDSYSTHPFIVMPYVGGGSLQQFVEKQGPLDPVQVVQIGKQVAAGLAAAHDVGVIHRDIKPANVLLENGCNRVLISDFGLAQVESDVSLTRTGFIAGTPYYMSPEQAQGRPTDARSDLFALGGILYFMSTGRPPFCADNAMAVLNKICKDPLLDVRHLNPEIPLPLANVIHTLLEKNIDHRFRDAAQVTQVMTEYLAHMQQPTVRRQPRVAAPRSMQQKRFRTIGTIAIVVSLTMFGLVGAWASGAFDTTEKPNHLPASQNALAPLSAFAAGDTDEVFDSKVRQLDGDLNSLEQVAPNPGLPSLEEDSELKWIDQQLRRLEQEDETWSANGF